MYFICTFNHCYELEMLINKLEDSGLGKEHILALPLQREQSKMYQITATSTGGTNIMDIPLAIGTVTMLLGVIYGFVLAWGPVLWGLIGLVSGTVAALLALYAFTGIRNHKNNHKKDSEVVLMINCPAIRSKPIEELIRSFNPRGIAVLDRSGGGWPVHSG